MSETTATRTLVKSPPELWAECSEASSLGRHLPQFGEIRITKLDPETAVAWEGEHVSGTVRIEPSGWGTRVTFTATAEPVEEPAAAEPEASPEPVAEPEPELEAAAAPETPLEPDAQAPPEPDAQTPPEPETTSPSRETPAAPPATPRPARGRGLFARLLVRLGFRPAPAPDAPAVTPATAQVEPQPAPVASTPEPVAVEPPPPAPDPEPKASEPEPEPVATRPEPETPTRSAADELKQIEAALTAALDSLGQAHHRPFSRA
jgi:hypothetical protein